MLPPTPQRKTTQSTTLQKPKTGIAAISPEWAKLMGIDGETDNPFASNQNAQQQPYNSDYADVLSGMASQTQQPYRPGWSALPGVATSLVGGMAARKLKNMPQQRDEKKQLQLQLLRQRLAQQKSGPAPRYMKSGNNIVSIDGSGQSKVVHRGQPSHLDQMRARILGELFPGTGQGAGDPSLQLQSGEVTSTDPNLIRTQTAAPSQPPGGAASAFSRLTPDQRLALGLNMVQPGLGNSLAKTQQQAQKEANFGDAATNEVQKSIVGTEEQYQQMLDVRRKFKPEFLTVQGRMQAEWYDLVDKLRVSDNPLTPEQKQHLTEFSQFKRSGLQLINDYIKKITGAQMSEAEADRIRQGIADVGEGLFDGDGPTQFMAKIDDAIKSTTMARARYHYMLKGGWSGTQMSPEDVSRAMKSGNAPLSLNDMEIIIQRRTKSIYQKMKNDQPDIDDGVLRKNAIQAARQEFGI